jgi:hypothetical protein
MLPAKDEARAPATGKSTRSTTAPQEEENEQLFAGFRLFHFFLVLTSTQKSI